MKKYLTPLIFGVIVLGIVIFAIVALRSPDKSQNQAAAGGTVTGADLTALQTGHDQGPADAKAVLVEFGDYQCPICGNAYPILKNDILPAYTGKVRFVFKNYPLVQPFIQDTVHKNAGVAAEAAEAAGAQGKYWEMHDMLYEHQNDWASLGDPVPVFGQYATAIGIDANRLMSEVRANKYQDVIQKDVDLANKITNNNFPGTPTFFVNGKQITGATGSDNYAALKQAIDAALGR